MTTLNVPVIPREVADAIESFRNDRWDNEKIIKCAAGGGTGVTDRACVIKAYASVKFDTLLAALINGYEVEKTAEEIAHAKILAEYRSHVFVPDPFDIGARFGIRFTLDALGIEIGNVNVPEGDA